MAASQELSIENLPTFYELDMFEDDYEEQDFEDNDAAYEETLLNTEETKEKTQAQDISLDDLRKLVDRFYQTSFTSSSTSSTNSQPVAPHAFSKERNPSITTF